MTEPKSRPQPGRKPVTELTPREQHTHDFLRLHNEYRRQQAELFRKRYGKKHDAK